MSVVINLNPCLLVLGCDPTGFAIVSSSEVDGALQGNDMFDLDDRDGVQIPAVNWISDNKFSVMEFSS